MTVSNELLTLVPLGAVALYTLVTAASRAIDRLLALAEYYDVSEVLVGMTILAVGMSLPEVSTHLVASLGLLSGVLDYQTTSAVVIGGNTGSSTVQQLFLVGVLLIGYGRLDLSSRFVRESYLPMLGVFVLTMLLAWDGTISRLDGFLLLALYVVYVGVAVTYRERTQTLREPPSTDPRRDAVVVIAMLGLVVFSASLILSIIEVVAALTGPTAREVPTRIIRLPVEFTCDARSGTVQNRRDPCEN